ncbi:MAG: ABC-F family ATP-binding cassette domain-containing protein [Proteobacteria bacterium]|nr:ABC-F family ATP-binding cassette domain-containing protein [Pseudomonadota bacterium]
MISIENISKSYGHQELFADASFKINPKERVGIVGRNGHGKTTLFRMIAGTETVEFGKIIIPKRYRIGYVRQHISFSKETVLKEAMTGLVDEEKDQAWKVERILFGLGFSDADMNRHPSEFSGGYQVRLNLVKVLASEPDLLLLDEPTNYLDITSIRWIERFLANWPRELALITHDRNFMDRIVTHVVGIHRKKIRKIEGDTGKYYTQIALDEEIYEKTRMNDEKKRKEIELFVSRFRAKARLANMVQSRIKTLSKMEKRDKLENVSTLEFAFRSLPYKGKHLLHAESLSFSYSQDTPLIDKVSIHIGASDRICVIGKNGKGKTTLLKMLAGDLTPEHGKITLTPGVKAGFYEQTNVKSLVDYRTVEEEITLAHEDVDRQLARNICGAMMFQGDLALKKIKVLSGGEKSRVMLGKLLATPLNLIFLDEPTNHLDMESCDSLLGAIDNFDGAVVMVTHNEMFLHALAEKLIVFKNDAIEVFDGSYQDFLEKIGWDDDASDEIKTKDVQVKNQDDGDGADISAKLNKKEIRKRRSEIINERSKTLKPYEKEMTSVEKKIEKTEAELEGLNQGMLDASQRGDGKRIGEISRNIHECQTRIETLYNRLEELSEIIDEKSAWFDKKLQAECE